MEPSAGRPPGASVAVVIAAALALAGCVSTSMSAAEVRTPVLFGPVPCIGCGPAARPAAPAPPVHVLAGSGAIGIALAFVYPIPVVVTAGETEVHEVSLDRLFAWEPCATDIQLAELRARAWFAMVPIFYFQYEVALGAEARRVSVSGAACRAR